jgi:hypothetical protein
VKADPRSPAGARHTDHKLPWLPIAAVVAIVLLICALVSPVALAVILIDGGVAAGILAAATGLGLWLAALAGLGRAELRWQLLAGCGLGIGALTLLVLGLGLLGVLQQWVWLALLLVFALGGAVRLIVLLRQHHPTLSINRTHWLWLIWAPAVAWTLLAATRPAGLPWGEEAGAYDVLAYHLNVPKEYFLAGRIEFLPHNVFSNMPFAAEMLYLLCVVLYDHPLAAVMAAQLCNAWLAVLAAGAGWLIGRTFGQGSGIIAGVLTGTLGWLMFTSGVAYVENGLMLFGLLSAAAMVKLATAPAETRGRWALLAGLFAGLACGFKYTGVPILAVPVVGIVAVLGAARRPRDWRLPIWTIVAIAIAFGPWLIKNWRMTGNPVFPLGYSVIGSKADAWNDELAEQWRRATTPTPEQQSVSNRLRFTAGRLTTDARFGGLTLLLALPILLSRRKRSAIDWLLAAWWFWQMVAWAVGTHLLARFGVTTIIPVIALAARSYAALDARWWQRAALAAAGMIAMVNVAWSTHFALDRFKADEWQWFGRTRARAELDAINLLTPPDARVLSVGNAATFYATRPVVYAAAMSRNEFAERAGEERPAELIAWLQARGITYVVVDWSEVERLRRTYGYWPAITPELFARLLHAGLSEYHPPDHQLPDYIQVFRVPTR